MPYLILIIGILVGLYGLYRFFLQANTKQIVSLFAVSGFTVICAALFFLAVTGRLPAALGLLAALYPFVIAFWHKRNKKAEAPPDVIPPSGPMTRREALEILGLQEGATREEIKESYKKLMKKAHPDKQGSEWLAAKVNEARDILLK